MSKVFRQRAITRRGKKMADGWEPVSLRFVPGDRISILFRNGKYVSASCLRCHDTPCATFSDHEITPINFERFPADRNNEVEDSVIDGPKSIIYDEAENRLHTAKGVMKLTMEG